jgi:predicted permease
MLGSLTIPLSLLVTGAQLGGLNLSERAPAGVTAATVATRLLAAPLVLIALWRAADRLIPVRLADADRDLTLLIMAMPPAVTVSLFVEHFGGNRALAGRTIVIGTLAGVATVPALLALARWIGP